MANELQINIGDSWKEADSIKINISDAWKEVSEIQINIGDTWKTAWKRKAAYFKVRYRAKNALGSYNGSIGVQIGAAGSYETGSWNSSWTNMETAALTVAGTSYTESECASMQVRLGSGPIAGGEAYYISEIEVDIYDDSDNLLATVKPNSDDTLTWDSTGANHYTEVDQGISGADDAKYVYTDAAYEVEYLGLENPSW